MVSSSCPEGTNLSPSFHDVEGSFLEAIAVAMLEPANSVVYVAEVAAICAAAKA